MLSTSDSEDQTYSGIPDLLHSVRIKAEICELYKTITKGEMEKNIRFTKQPFSSLVLRIFCCRTFATHADVLSKVPSDHEIQKQ